MISTMEPPDWDSLGHDWPNRQHSKFVRSRGQTFHVQRAGKGRSILLLHGTGSATHTWRDVFPRLAQQADTIAIDLPGHGFSSHPGYERLSLPGMARDIGALMQHLEIDISAIVGHSAGAAIACRMALDDRTRPERIVSLNGALLPFDGIGRTLFPSLAKVLFVNPLTPRIFAWQARSANVVERLLNNTGSSIDDDMMARYAGLFRSTGHVDGALSMMANWDLETLRRDLPRLKVPLTLIAALQDKTIPPDVSRRVQKLVPGATLVELADLGHLAHEESADRVSAVICDTLGLAEPAASQRAE